MSIASGQLLASCLRRLSNPYAPRQCGRTDATRLVARLLQRVRVKQRTSARTHVDIAAILLSGQMQDLILLDDEDALGNAVLYADGRAQDEAAAIQVEIGAQTLTAITGNEQGPASVLAKWKWLQIHEPQRLASARALLVGAHDYVGWRLCGTVGADYTTASTTGLVDLSQRAWASAMLTHLGLSPMLLPPLRRTGETLGKVTAAAASATGLPVGTPVLVGVGDLGATTVGVGAGEPGTAYAYLGTSGWIAASLPEAIPMPERGVFTLIHPDGRRFVQVAPMVTAGGNLEWLRSQLAGDGADPISFERLNDAAAAAPLGSGGLLYLPYLKGERSPFSDPDVRAAFLGISASTTRAELVRAVMEGTALAFRALHEALGLTIGPLRLAGGGANSPLWAQILADVLGGPVQVVAQPGEAPARGAAILAGQALGWFDSLAPDADFFPTASTYSPVTEESEAYPRLYAIFAQLYPLLRTTYGDLAAFRQTAD